MKWPLPQKLSNKLPSWKSILLRSSEPRIYTNQPNESPEFWILNVLIQKSEICRGIGQALLSFSSLRTLPRVSLVPSQLPALVLHLPGGQLQHLTLLSAFWEGFPCHYFDLAELLAATFAGERATKEPLNSGVAMAPANCSTWRMCPGCLLNSPTC